MSGCGCRPDAVPGLVSADSPDIPIRAVAPGLILAELGGRVWRLERIADLETLWDELGEKDFDEDERLPYWTELWPASLALGRWLLARGRELEGKVVLDVGCGLGLTAMVASSLGARTVALDYEPLALKYARANAGINDVPQPLWTLMDWRNPAIRPGSAPLVCGADVMYERRFIEPVGLFLEHVLAPDGLVVIAEPNRNVYPEFAEFMRGRGWRVEIASTDTVRQAPCPATVNLWELKRT